MKIFKKAVTAFLAISTVVSLVACGGSGQGDYYGSNDNKLSIFRWDFDGLNTARKQKTDVYKILEEKAGMPIFAVTTGSADWETQLSTKFATEMLPDVFVSKGPEVPEQYKDMIEDGVLLPVSDYVSETEYPNIYRQLQDFDYLKTNLSYADGKHWSIPVDWTLEHTMYIRQDWLDNLNEPSKLRKCLADEKGISESQVTEKMLEEEKYEVPETLLDFYRVARAFTLYDPDGNGKNDTYGYTSTQELWTDINVIINKSLLSSLFNEKLNELNREQVSGKKLEQGEYAETPKYLEDYEIEELKDLRN